MREMRNRLRAKPEWVRDLLAFLVAVPAVFLALLMFEMGSTYVFRSLPFATMSTNAFVATVIAYVLLMVAVIAWIVLRHPTWRVPMISAGGFVVLIDQLWRIFAR